MVGRRVLIKSILESISSHYFQSSLIPKFIYHRIDAISRDFLWDSSEVKRKMHLIGWNKVTNNIREGGIDIHKAHFRNLAYISKLSWRFLKETEKPWVKCLYHRYVYNRSRLKSVCSPI